VIDLHLKSFKVLRLGRTVILSEPLIKSEWNSQVTETAIRTYRFKLKPTSAQHNALRAALDHSRQLYNAALEERIDCYRKTGKGRTYFDQCKALTELRTCGSRYAVAMERSPLKSLDLAYKSFFKRGGFPRFKGRDWFKSIGWNDTDGWRLKVSKFYAKGIGAIPVHMHREIPSQPKMARIKREGRHWFLTLVCEVAKTDAANDNPAIGIDLGMTTLAALSNGEMIENVHPHKRAMRKLRIRQRALSRCNRGSKNRRKARERLANAHAKIRQTRDTYLHQVSADLIKRYGLIAIENLNVKGLAKGILAREVNDASWGKLIRFLKYKAESAGVSIVEVDPRGTSQTCPECGTIKAKTLSERVHRCECGCVMDRDTAAAKVVLFRAMHSPSEGNVGGYVERSRRKVAA
jgi:putative transposase